MKNLFFILFILLPFTAPAQGKGTLPVIPMKNGRIFYEKSIQLNGNLSKEELYSRALKWLKTAFPLAEKNIKTADPEKGEIEGNGLYKIVTGSSYYWLKFDLHLVITDGQYKLDVTHFYEKPIQKNVSNAYSKIEYRWWDNRQGKPWYPEDHILFTSLDNDINNMMASLEKELTLPASQTPKFKAVAFYTTTVESDHVDFAKDAMKFYRKMAAKDNFVFDTTTNWKNMNPEYLKNYQLVIWLDDFPQNETQRKSFEQYMENGGGWLGFHVAGYNDKYTKWQWFVNFFGGAVFYNNNWPPLPAKLIVDDNKHPATKSLPSTYISTLNEWYGWKPSPRVNKDIKVLVTLDPSNYPLGKKDIIREGDIPVVWTNTKYKMLYMNMGHGDQIFYSDIQNKLFEDAVLWLGTKK